jgi:hypothetical protein
MPVLQTIFHCVTYSFVAANGARSRAVLLSGTVHLSSVLESLGSITQAQIVFGRRIPQIEGIVANE